MNLILKFSWVRAKYYTKYNNEAMYQLLFDPLPMYVDQEEDNVTDDEESDFSDGEDETSEDYDYFLKELQKTINIFLETGDTYQHLMISRFRAAEIFQYHSLFGLFAYIGDLEAGQLFLDSFDLSNYIRSDFLSACFGGQLEICKFFYENYPALKEIDNFDIYLEHAKLSGKDEVYQWLIKTFIEK